MSSGVNEGEGISTLPRGTVTFMLTDIEGSTRQWQQHPDGMQAAITRHDQILASAVRSNAGLVLKKRGEGDSVFAVFARASNAIAAARDIQRALRVEAWPEGVPIRVRIAIHTGEAHEEGVDDYRGPVVNRCARLRALARGGEVLISSSARELVQDRLPEGIFLRDGGLHQLRDLERPEHVYQVVDPELQPPSSVREERPRLILYGGVAILFVVAVALGVFTLVKALQPSGPAIMTVAGTGVDGDSGLTQTAASAEISRPAGVATGFGGVYIAQGQRIREVTPDGKIQTVAGTGAVGFAGDGGKATMAQLDLIQGGNVFGAADGIAVDQVGNVYFSDGYNQRIRKVGIDGTITTVAGSGTGTGGFGGDGGPATQALLNSPRGIAAEPFGAVYIADTDNNRIRKVDLNGVITTVVGTGAAGDGGDGGLATLAELNAPQGVAIDLDGNLYIADTGNNRIRRVDASSGVITTVAGVGQSGYSGDGGQATAAELNFPASVAIGPGGIIYIADSQNNRIRKVDGGTITTVAGTGASGNSGDGSSATSAQLKLPLGVAVDLSGAVFIADSENNRVRKVH